MLYIRVCKATPGTSRMAAMLHFYATLNSSTMPTFLPLFLFFLFSFSSSQERAREHRGGKQRGGQRRLVLPEG